MFFHSGYRRMCIIFKRRRTRDRDVNGSPLCEGSKGVERFLPIIRNAPFDLRMLIHKTLALYLGKITGEGCAVYGDYKLSTLLRRNVGLFIFFFFSFVHGYIEGVREELSLWRSICLAIIFSEKISESKLGVAVPPSSREFIRLLLYSLVYEYLFIKLQSCN